MYSPGKNYQLTDLLKKADAGDMNAMSEIVSLIAAEGYLKDPQEIDIQDRYITYLEMLATSGDSEAYIMLGDAYKDGTGVSQDPQKAVAWYEKAAGAGEPFGNECIGMMYYDGDVIPQDYQKAFTYFTKTDGRKSFCTLYALGEMYRCGYYVERDGNKACEYYQKIVYSDEQFAFLDDYYWRSCFRLACAYHYGTGVERNLNLASKVLEKAHELRSERSYDTVIDIPDDEFFSELARLNQDRGLL